MKFRKIVGLDGTGIEDVAGEALASLCDTLTLYAGDPVSGQEILSRAQGADALLLSWRTRLTRDVLAALPDLRYIGLCCTLYEGASSNVDLAAARQNGILVKGVRDYGDNGVVEFLYSELIRLVKGLGDQQLCDEPAELDGMRLGIVGLGAVGRMMASVGVAFGMEVAYYSRTQYVDVPYRYRTLSDLLTHCDVISAHLPRDVVLLDEAGFSRLGNGKILMNTGLQPCYEEAAFRKWIGQANNYAILDACAVNEPLRRDYAAYPHIILGKRTSGFTQNARKRLADGVVANAMAALRELEASFPAKQ